MANFGPTVITRVLSITGSLMSFYDEIVYWEMAKGTNRFFVTFEKGAGGINNNQRESIGTAELSFPNVSAFTSSGFLTPNSTRRSARFDIFLQQEERDIGPSNHFYQGFIPITELKGTNNQYATNFTSSRFVDKTYHYETHHNGQTKEAFRQVSASYFYPFTNYQMSVLRETPCLLINLDKESELPEGMGDAGFVIIPENTHPKIKNNWEKYLKKAGLLPSFPETDTDDAPPTPEEGGGGPLKGGIGTPFDFDPLDDNS